MQFEALGVDRCVVPLAVMYVDHNVLQLDTRDMEAHRYLREFSRPLRAALLAARQRDLALRAPRAVLAAGRAAPRRGLAHDRGRRGRLASRSARAGSRWRSRWPGIPFVTAAPEIVGVRLDGALSDWVEAKDVILELLRRFGVRGGVGTIFEFFGDGVATLSATERATICNMVVETGATTGVFPSDGARARVARGAGARRRLGRARRRTPAPSTTGSRRSTSPRSSP